jgi:hypothetical protein
MPTPPFFLLAALVLASSGTRHLGPPANRSLVAICCTASCVPHSLMSIFFFAVRKTGARPVPDVPADYRSSHRSTHRPSDAVPHPVDERVRAGEHGGGALSRGAALVRNLLWVRERLSLENVRRRRHRRCHGGVDLPLRQLRHLARPLRGIDVLVLEVPWCVLIIALPKRALLRKRLLRGCTHAPPPPLPIATACADINDGYECGLRSTIRWNSTAGVTYRIQVTGSDPTSFGAFELVVHGSNGPLVEVPGPYGPNSVVAPPTTCLPLLVMHS